MSDKAPTFDERSAEFYTVLAVIAFNVLTTVWFIVLNNKPLSWDPALHMLYSYVYYKLLTMFNFGALVHVSNYYPPFFHLTAAFMYVLFGFSEKIAVATNILYYFLLVFAVYKTATEVWDRRAGYFSVMLISGYPLLVIMERKFMIDFAFTAMVALTVYFFVKSRGLRDLRYSALFGLSFGLTTLTKWNAFIYILPFALADLYFEYSENIRDVKNALGNVSVAAAVAFVSAAWWYLPNLFVVFKRLEYFASIGGKEGDPTFWTLKGWLYYLKDLDASVGIVFMLTFLAAVVWFAYRRKVSKKMDRYVKAMLFSLLTTYVILTFLSNKDHRYILPLLPYVAWISGVFLRDVSEELSGKLGLKKVVFTVLISLVVLVQLSAVSFAVPNLHNPYLLSSDRPESQNWHINDILNTIAKYARPGDVVITLADHPYLNGQSLDFYRVIHGYDFRVFNGVYLPVNAVVKNFNKINFVIIIEPREHKGVYGKAETLLYKAFYQHKDSFELIGEFHLPDNSTAYIYMNRACH